MAWTGSAAAVPLVEKKKNVIATKVAPDETIAGKDRTCLFIWLSPWLGQDDFR